MSLAARPPRHAGNALGGRPRPPRAIGAAVLALLAGTACVHASPAVRADGCTLPGVGAWREYRSKHFDIDAAGWEGDPARLVGAFEELRAAVIAALVLEPVEIPGRVRVIVLPARRDVGELGGARVAALFWVSQLGEPTILISAEDVDDVPQVVAHELTHHVSYHLFPRQPYWFTEGLAQFVEGVAKKDEQGRRWLGVDPVWSGRVAGDIKVTQGACLLSGCHSDANDDPYVSAWLLYRFLWNERGPQLSEFQRRLADGDAPMDAWRAAFPEWDASTGAIRLLDVPLVTHQRRGRGVRGEVRLPEVDRSFTASGASTADVHAALLDLQLGGANRLLHDSMRRRNAEEMLLEEPGHPLATAELARLDGRPAVSALRASAATRPEDPRAWFLLGSATDDDAERETSLRRAADLWPDGALAQTALAAHLAATGRAREALGFANRAVDLAPWSPGAVSTLATVAAELGKCGQALLLQRRAVEVARTAVVGARGADAAALERRLSELRVRCEAAGGAKR
jgi:tetratricopeptide (TPR) repeat protein